MILRTLAGGERSVRDVSLGTLIAAENGLRGSASTAVTQRAVLGLPAWLAAVRLASQAVASRKLRVYRGDGALKTRMRSTWQARFFAAAPNERESWFAVWAQTEASLTNSHNAYWTLMLDDAGRVAAVYVADPQAVEVRWNRDQKRKEYRVTRDDGSKSEWLTGQTVIHFRALNLPGWLVDPSPIALHRESLSSALAKVRYESAYYDEGIMQSLAVTFPKEMKPEEADRWRQVFQATHAGASNAHQVRVFGGGSSVSTIGLSLKDSQYIESMQFSIEDVARMTGVQASLLGATSSTGGKDAAAPLSPEHEEDRWFRYGLGPRLTRNEETVGVHPGFFGPGSRDYPRFDNEGVRGDVKTEDDIAHQQIQDGRLLVDEWRAANGLDPLPGGLGKIPQVVPVGGAPNPAPAPPDDPQT